MAQYILKAGYLGYVLPIEHGERLVKEPNEPIETLKQIVKILNITDKIIKVKFECLGYEEIKELKKILTKYKFKNFLADLTWLETKRFIKHLLGLNESLKKKKDFMHFFLTLTLLDIEIEIVDCEYYLSIEAPLKSLNELKYELTKNKRITLYTGKEIELKKI